MSRQPPICPADVAPQGIGGASFTGQGLANPLIIAFFGLLLPGTAYSADGVFPYAIESKTLENGLDVHVVPMPTPGVAAWYTWMDVGSRDEVDPGRTGFAHFFEHLMFFGTETLPGDAREREVLRLGSDENAWTWLDETVYHSSIAADRIPRLAEIEADRFQNLLLTAEDVKRESGAVYGEYRKGQANPGSRLGQAIYATAFQTHTYGHDTIGYEADIAAMPTAHEYGLAFFDRFYRPENATIFVAGDVQAEAVFALVDEHWASWKPGTTKRPEIPAEPPQTELRTRELKWPDPTAARLGMGWKIPGQNPDDPEVARLQLVEDLLLADTGPLKRRLVREEGLAYSVSGGRDNFVDPGLFYVQITLKDPEHIDRAEAVLREEIAALATIDPALLDRTRQHARYGFLSGLDTPAAVCGALGWHTRRGGSVDAIDRFYVHYDAATPEQVSAVAAKYLVDTGLTRGTLVHDPEAGPVPPETPPAPTPEVPE